jgi:hypothetical protein
MGIIDEVRKEVEAELKEQNNDRGALDVLTEKVISRKFLVWATATVLVIAGKLTPDEWVAISLGYVGVEGVADLAVKWKTAGK